MIETIKNFICRMIAMAFPQPKDPFEGIDTVDTTAEEDIMEWNVTLPDVKTGAELHSMTKAQLVEYGQQFGLDVLKVSWTKTRIINEISANGLVRSDS